VAPRLDIETGRGLIEQDEVRASDQRKSKGESALLPAGQAAGLAAALVDKPNRSSSGPVAIGSG